MPGVFDVTSLAWRLGEAHQRQRKFAADGSHDLRIPLALIKGEASLARAPDTTSAQRLSALGIIEAEADRLIHLVEDLLFLARVDRGQLRRADLVGLDELAHEIGARYGKLAESHALQLRIEAPQSVVVRGDEMALRRVLVNLTQNALEHTQAGEVFIGVSFEEGTAQVEVRDTGCGIPSTDQLRVFDRFYRVDAARARGSAGLGLALCREIVLAHGGTIHLESEPGNGTRVQFSLPSAS